jgi:hypothetical protein
MDIVALYHTKALFLIFISHLSLRDAVSLPGPRATQGIKVLLTPFSVKTIPLTVSQS